MPKPITGLSAKQMDSLRRDANGVVSRFDRNGDGKISRDEAKASKRIDTYSSDYTTRISADYVNRTTVIYDRMATMENDAFASDVDGDGFLSAEDMVQSTLERADSNGDGNLSKWEKFKASFNVQGRVERHYDVEISRRNRLEYYPDPDLQRPTPPSPDYRPTPPSGGYDDRPTPPSSGGYNDRPTPPSSGGYNDRPTPPGGNSSRPTPPSSSGGYNDRPTPPGGSSSRPTPPGGSSSDSRPTPPGSSSSGSRPTPPGGSSSRPTPPGA